MQTVISATKTFDKMPLEEDLHNYLEKVDGGLVKIAENYQAELVWPTPAKANNPQSSTGIKRYRLPGEGALFTKLISDMHASVSAYIKVVSEVDSLRNGLATDIRKMFTQENFGRITQKSFSHIANRPKIEA